MPEDWQLSFYNTQFRCVYLPYSTWRSATDEEIGAWLQETQERFIFVLQVADIANEDDRRKALRFGARGLADNEIDLHWLNAAPDMRRLAQRMQQAAASGVPLFIISREGRLSQLRQVGELMQVLGV
jgi:uncharacterized protein YecE (DUF72 family)